MKTKITIAATAFVFAIGGNMKAQNVLFVGDSIYVQSGVNFWVQGGVLGTTGGYIKNDGNLYVDADLTPGGENWTNNAGTGFLDVSGTGDVFFQSSGAQSIGGTSVTTFNNVTLSGANLTTLISEGDILGVMAVGNSTLDLNSNILKILNPNTSAITVGTGGIKSEQTDNSSKVIWTIGTATGDHIIPFVNAAGNQIPFHFNLSSGNAGDVTVATYPTGSNLEPYPTTPIAVSNILSQPPYVVTPYNDSAYMVRRYWLIQNSTGSGAATADITFTYATSEEPTNGEVNMQAQAWESTEWFYAPTFSNNATANTVTSLAVSSFSEWAVEQNGSPLPIELSSFIGWNEGTVNQLSWTTQVETNSDHFELQRSDASMNFQTINSQLAAVTSTHQLNYRYTDHQPLAAGYYRLKSVDQDGQYTYSNIVFIQMASPEINISSVYPNPATDFIAIDIYSMNDDAMTLSLTDVLGRVLETKIIQATTGNNHLVMNTRNLPAATYFIKVEGNSNHITSEQPFVKVN